MPDYLNITDSLYDFARKNPDKPALLHPVVLTFSGLCSGIDKYASGFLEAGIVPGTRTIVMIRQGPDFYTVVYALLRIGAVPVLIDPGMGIRAMSAALSGAEAHAFIGIPRSIILRYIFPMAYRSVRIWISTAPTVLCKSMVLDKYKPPEKFTSVSRKVKADDIAAIFFTSGSTGPAKGVIYRNYMLIAQISILRDHFKYEADEIDLCTFSLIGLLLMSLGISGVIADMDMTKPGSFRPELLINNINRFSCTHLFCSPMILGRLAEFGNENHRPVPSLKTIMTAGAPVLPGVLRKTRKWIPPDAEIHTPYGATEALPVTDICDSELLSLYGGLDYYPSGICVGYPIENIEVKIIKITDGIIELWDENIIAAEGEVGEISIMGPNVTQEYLANKEATRRSKILDTEIGFFWHRTGDLGRTDRCGRIWFYGRKSQRVETGERTLFTIPCEALFNMHPSVARSALVGIDSLIPGIKVPVICIELKKGFTGKTAIRQELLGIASGNEITKDIKIILFHKKFPVDPRHNAKIFRERLAVWAQKKLS